MAQRHIGWVASLRSGETVFERPVDRGELSAWQQLLQRCQNDNEQIMRLQLQRGGASALSLPRKRKPSMIGAIGFFQAYEIQKTNAGNNAHFQGIGSVLDVAGQEPLVFITWMNDSGQVWQDVRPLSMIYVHTDLRQMVDIL